MRLDQGCQDLQHHRVRDRLHRLLHVLLVHCSRPTPEAARRTTAAADSATAAVAAAVDAVALLHLQAPHHLAPTRPSHIHGRVPSRCGRTTGPVALQRRRPTCVHRHAPLRWSLQRRLWSSPVRLTLWGACSTGLPGPLAGLPGALAGLPRHHSALVRATIALEPYSWRLLESGLAGAVIQHHDAQPANDSIRVVCQFGRRFPYDCGCW